MVDTDSVTLFFALLALVSQLTVLAVVGLFVAGRVSSSRLFASAKKLDISVRKALSPQAVQLAVIVAIVATSGSLYLSEVAHFIPCRLCWYQRFAMYPLVPILILLAWRKSPTLGRFVVVIPLVGASISAYHMVIERFPSLESSTCDPTNPCSLIWVERFGYLTIPTMALSGFLLIATLLFVSNSFEQRKAIDTRD